MSWEDVNYRRVPVKSPKIDTFLEAICKTHVNGGAVLACFEPLIPGIFDEAANHDLCGIENLFETFLTRPSVLKSLPELKMAAPLDPAPQFQQTVALAMEGELTHILLAGGAYERFHGGMSKARKISHEFMEDIVQDRWLELWIGVSHVPWSEWFCDVAWDASFIVHDRQVRRFWLLCITDTD